MRVAAAVLAFVAAACGDAATPAAPTAPPTSAPPLRTVDLPALRAHLDAQKGKPMLVNFWGTWCLPCVQEMPDLLAGTKAFRDRGGVVVLVAMERMRRNATDAEAEARVAKLAPELGIDFPTVICNSDDIQAVRKAIGVEIGGLPQTLAYNRAGKLVEHHEGMATQEQFLAMVEAAER